MVGIFLLLSPSTNAENNQTGGGEVQHEVTGKKKWTIPFLYWPSTSFSNKNHLDARTAIMGCAKRAEFLKPNGVEPIR